LVKKRLENTWTQINAQGRQKNFFLLFLIRYRTNRMNTYILISNLTWKIILIV